MFFLKIFKKVRIAFQILLSLAGREERRAFIELLKLYRAEHIVQGRRTRADYRNCLPKTSSPAFLLVSHELSRTGAPQALLQMACAIQELLHVCPVILSPEDGPLRAEFESRGMTVAIDDRLISRYFYSDLAAIVSMYDHVIVQTVCLPEFLIHYSPYCGDCINWVHETYDGFLKHITHRYDILKSSPKTLPFRIWCGSGLSLKIADYFGKAHEILFYAVADVYHQRPGHLSSEKITFLLVGELSERKAQKVYIQAISLLAPAIRQRASFYLVGGSTREPEYAAEVLQEASGFSEIRHYCNMPLADLFDIYYKSDVLISTSVDDPMPTVVTYALMLGMPSIVSDSIGHAKIFSEKDGLFIVPTGDAQKLADTMTQFITGKLSLDSCREQSRNAYLQHFSIESFKKNFMWLLRENSTDRNTG